MRDYRIDFLRFLGFALIILAHIQPPNLIFTLRVFDVPMMMLISGASCSLSTSKDTYFQYVIKRFKRLVLPLWMFLALFFCMRYALGDPCSISIMLSSFTGIKGIGYVWIIRVFFIVAILWPFIKRFSESISSNWTYLALIGAACLANEIFVQGTLKFLNNGSTRFFLNNFWDGITYSLLFAIGLRFHKYSNKQFLLICVCSLLIFIGCATLIYCNSGDFKSFKNFKYPPRLYFLSYGIIASIVCWYLSKYINRLKPILPVILFLGQNTLWIYFWHIVYLYVFKHYETNFIARYFIIIISSTVTYFCQYYLIKEIIVPKLDSKKAKEYLCMLFTG